MRRDRLLLALQNMIEAARHAQSYTDGIDISDFIKDAKTCDAVAMNLVVVGEIAANVVRNYPEFAKRHAHIPWEVIRGIRNRIAHGYFDIDFVIVWETVRFGLTDLLPQLHDALADAEALNFPGDFDEGSS